MELAIDLVYYLTHADLALYVEQQKVLGRIWAAQKTTHI